MPQRTFLQGAQSALTLALLCGTAFLSGACGEPVGAKRAPVTLKIGIAVPSTGQASASGANAFVNSYLLSDTLVGIGWDGRPSPRLGASWEPLRDNPGVRVTLEPNAQMHDGTPLTAELATTILRGAIESSLKRNQGAVSFPSITALTPESERTFAVKLSRPEAFLLTDLANPNFQHPTKERVGTGPYKFGESTDENNVVRAVANESYFRGRPEIDAFEVRNYREHRAAWSALMRGEIDAVHELSPGGVEFVEKASTVKTFPSMRPYYIALMFSQRHPILKNAPVRQALSQAVDRKKVIDLGLNGRGTVADGPIWPYHWAYSTAQRTYSYNPEAATLRLDAAGYPIRIDERGMPIRFRFKCIILAGDSRYERIALVLQKQLFDIGVDLEIEPVEGRDIGGRIYAGEYDAFLFEWSSGRSLGMTYATWHSHVRTQFNPRTGYSAADEVLDRLRITTEDAAVRAAVGDLQRVFYDDPPGVFIAWPQVTRAINSTLFEVPDEPGRDVLGTLYQWKPAARATGRGR